MRKRTLISAALLLASFGAQAQEGNNDGSGYGKNIISIIPFSGYASEQVGDVMVGLSYEHILNDFVSIKVPVRVGLVNNSFQGAISAKFYTNGHDAPVTYSLGPALIFTHATKEDQYYLFELNPCGDPYYTETTVSQFGFMLVNSLNVTIQKNIFFGVDMGLGLNYLNQLKYNNRDTYDDYPSVNFNFDISMGYRF